MQGLYDIFITLFDTLFTVTFGIIAPIPTMIIDVTGTISLITNALPLVAPFFIFWFDTELFPAYFQSALFVYITVSLVISAINILAYYKLIPFV